MFSSIYQKNRFSLQVLLQPQIFSAELPDVIPRLCCFRYYTFARMFIDILKSKIHRAVITEANLHYVGSLTLDEDLMDAANLIENEKIQVVNVNNGERLETYIIKGKRGSGTVCLNGPAARRGAVGDVIIIISYASINFDEAKQFKPAIVFPKEGNKL